MVTVNKLSRLSVQAINLNKYVLPYKIFYLSNNMENFSGHLPFSALRYLKRELIYEMKISSILKPLQSLYQQGEYFFRFPFYSCLASAMKKLLKYLYNLFLAATLFSLFR